MKGTKCPQSPYESDLSPKDKYLRDLRKTLIIVFVISLVSIGVWSVFFAEPNVIDIIKMPTLGESINAAVDEQVDKSYDYNTYFVYITKWEYIGCVESGENVEAVIYVTVIYEDLRDAVLEDTRALFIEFSPRISVYDIVNTTEPFDCKVTEFYVEGFDLIGSRQIVDGVEH